MNTYIGEGSYIPASAVPRTYKVGDRDTYFPRVINWFIC